MKVRIIREPRGVIDGMSLSYYHAGRTYDVPPLLGAYLVAEGVAEIEMRERKRSRRARESDRRRPPRRH